MRFTGSKRGIGACCRRSPRRWWRSATTRASAIARRARWRRSHEHSRSECDQKWALLRRRRRRRMSGGLYDIAEPGASAPKEACAGRAVGIDLGTTNSLVAIVRDASPICLPDGEGRALLPSAVRYQAGAAPVVGWDALARAAEFPRDTIVSVKRFMGRGPEDAETTRRFTPYRFASQTGPVVRFTVAGRAEGVTPMEVSAEILRAL